MKKSWKTEKALKHFQEIQISDDESEDKNDSSIAECVESGKIPSSCSEWKTGSDRELFVTSLNSNSDKIGKGTKK